MLTSSPQTFEFFLFLIGLVAGCFGAIVGLGGGAIVVPALTLLFNINIRYAIGASIVSVIATSSGAAAAYIKDHLTNIRLAIFLEVATTLGAIVGATLSTHFSVRVLFAIFAAVLAYSAFMMIRKRQRAPADSVLPTACHPLAVKLKLTSSFPDAQLGRTISYGVQRVPLGFALMAGAGVMSGLLGIGSGALKVPAMDMAMGLPIKVSAATSNFMIGVTAAASAGAYYVRGDILPMIAAPVALGVIAGSWLGTKLMVRLPSEKIRTFFIIILVLVAAQMALRAWGLGWKS